MCYPGDQIKEIYFDGEDWDDDVHGILMQYTGLQDLQGKDIYEGDVVRTNVIECNEDEGPIYGMVGAVEITPYETVFGEYRSSACETPLVIGNIYEQHERLP